MLGDGEIQEGMVWEAVQVAARYKLSNLTAIIDRNGLQQFGLPSSDETTLTDRGDRRDPWFGVDLAAVFQAFGWRVVEIDGHDYDQIKSAYQLARSPATHSTGRPSSSPTPSRARACRWPRASTPGTASCPPPEDFERARRSWSPTSSTSWTTTLHQHLSRTGAQA